MQSFDPDNYFESFSSSQINRSSYPWLKIPSHLQAAYQLLLHCGTFGHPNNTYFKFYEPHEAKKHLNSM